MGKRKTYVDVLRIVAACLVFLVHTGQRFCWHYEIAGNAFSYCVDMVMHELVQVGPSLFFFISGITLLGKEESYKTLMLKRFLRFFLITIGFSLLQVLYAALANPEILKNPFLKVLADIYGNAVIEEYWFLYAYLGFILILPFLRKTASKMTNRDFNFLTALYLIFNVILPVAERILDLDTINIAVPVLTNIVFFPLAGYMCDRMDDSFFKKRNLVLTVLVFVGTLFVECLFRHLYLQRGADMSIPGTYGILCICIFIFVKALFAKKDAKEKTSRFLMFLAGGAFLEYLLCRQLTDVLCPIYDFTKNYVTYFGASVIWMAAALILSSSVAFVIHKIPGFGKN